MKYPLLIHNRAAFRHRLADTSQERFHQRMNVNKTGVFVKHKYCAPEYNVPPFSGIGQGGHICLLIGPENTNLVEDIEFLLPFKFR